MESQSEEREPKAKYHHGFQQQATLHKYFQRQLDDGEASQHLTPAQPATSSTPLVAELTPQFFDIQTYTESQINEAPGLLQDFKRFWNEKATELCKDASVCAKLKHNKVAIQGAIQTAWVLHKTSLLELKAEKVKEESKVVFHDEITLSHILTPVDKNTERMRTAHAIVNALVTAVSSSPDRKKAEHELEKGMCELRRAQAALSKAIDRRQKDIQLVESEKETLLTAASPVKLSQSEIEQLAESIKVEVQDTDFEELV